MSMLIIALVIEGPRINERTNQRMDGKKGRWTDGRTDIGRGGKRTDRHTDRLVYRQTDGMVLKQSEAQRPRSGRNWQFGIEPSM